jgi:hypothetical protein
MGCHYVTEKSVRYFIPDCWSAVIHGEKACTCPKRNGKRMNETELIADLEKENNSLYKVMTLRLKDLLSEFLTWQQENPVFKGSQQDMINAFLQDMKTKK